MGVPGCCRLTPTSVNVPRAQVTAGDLLKLVAMVFVELLDVALLVIDHFIQGLDFCSQRLHLPLT